eukprot:TRINITY_DN15875_c0_g1_i1.p2 TRINITY_DN15875_c0_g1~~TRINITY_DN15875_c0_g1_i1.p2  ORF type:complete len:106 (+),score=26.00 TRINITY_DN15875_c0_g1_i1:70-387(+)
MIRRPPRSTLSSSSAASDVYKRQLDYVPVFREDWHPKLKQHIEFRLSEIQGVSRDELRRRDAERRNAFKTSIQSALALALAVAWSNFVGYQLLSLIHISEPTRPY